MATRRRKVLPPYHRAMLDACVRGLSTEDAAKEAGISARQARRWKQLHADELKRPRSQVAAAAADEFGAGLSLAFCTLRELATDPKAAATMGADVRRAAAVGIVEGFRVLVEAQVREQPPAASAPSQKSPDNVWPFPKPLAQGAR